MMEKFFQFHSKLDWFRPFLAEHLVTIALIVAGAILLFVFKTKLMKSQRAICLSAAFFLLATVLSYHLWLIFEQAWSVKTSLPLQLSDLAVILAIIMLLTKSNRLFQFMYFAGLASSLQAILTPDLHRFSFPHFRYIEFFAVHGGVVLACLFMVAALCFRPAIRSLWFTALIVTIYAFFIFFFNKSLGSNYLYIMKKPESTSLLNYLGSWPWYLVSMEAVMIISFFLLYSPFWLKRKMGRQK